MKVDKPNLAVVGRVSQRNFPSSLLDQVVKGTEEVYAEVDGWISSLVERDWYDKEVKLSVEKWVAVRL